MNQKQKITDRGINLKFRRNFLDRTKGQIKRLKKQKKQIEESKNLKEYKEKKGKLYEQIKIIRKNKHSIRKLP